MNTAVSLRGKLILALLVMACLVCLPGISYAREKAKQSKQAHAASVAKLTNAIKRVQPCEILRYSPTDWQQLFVVAKLLQDSDPSLVSEAFAYFDHRPYKEAYDNSHLLLLFSAMFDLPEKALVSLFPVGSHWLRESRAFSRSRTYINLAWPITWQGKIPEILYDHNKPLPSFYDSQKVYGDLLASYKFRRLERYLLFPSTARVQRYIDSVTKLTKIIQSVREWDPTSYPEPDWQRLFTVAKLLQNSDPHLVSDAIALLEHDELFGRPYSLRLLLSAMFDLPERVRFEGGYQNLAWPITWQGAKPAFIAVGSDWGVTYNGCYSYNDDRKHYKYRSLDRYLTKKPTVRKPYP